jgi:hypothetical protein
VLCFLYYIVFFVALALFSHLFSPLLSSHHHHIPAEAGRDCSGRGHCDAANGTCHCYAGFFGGSCGAQLVLY